jgi:predicted subunit of tRNA(5-methylaminomethyl-2-thiouridylate) methyltransferase
MDVYVLFSGGKDSSLSAVILKKLGYNPHLITINFGVIPSYKLAEETAKILGFRHKVITLDRKIVEKAADMVIEHKYPSPAIQYVHKTVLEILADEYSILADGTRRDDKVPKLSYSEIQSLEMRKNIQYITPLMGFGYKTLRHLASEFFIIEEIKSGIRLSSDYEAEIRHILKERGENPEKYFPEHKQTRVVGLKKEI